MRADYRPVSATVSAPVHVLVPWKDTLLPASRGSQKPSRAEAEARPKAREPPQVLRSTEAVAWMGHSEALFARQGQSARLERRALRPASHLPAASRQDLSPDCCFKLQPPTEGQFTSLGHSAHQPSPRLSAPTLSKGTRVTKELICSAPPHSATHTSPSPH